MQILLKLFPSEIAMLGPERDEATTEILAHGLFDRLQETYCDYADDSEAYLHEPDDTGSYVEDMELVLGADDPGKIRSIAEGWNMSLAQEMERVLSKIQACQADGIHGARRWLSAATVDLYELKKAAMALDNDFYSFADKCLLLCGHPTARFSNDAELAPVLADPGSYAVVAVYPK